MPLFDEEQIKEILGAVRGSLGLEEAQKLTDVLETQVNDVLNRYDKRQKKEREKAEETLNETLDEIRAALKKVGEKPPEGDPDNPPKTPEGVDLSKLPEGVRALITGLNTKVTELSENFERSEKAREKAESERKEIEAEREAANTRNTIRDTLLNRETVGVDFDPDGLDILVRELEPRVSKNDAGEHLFDTGKRDSITQDPVLKPLGDGLKEFSGTGIAKKFQRSRSGKPPGVPLEGGHETPAGSVAGSELDGKSASEIDKLAGEGKIDFSQ